MSNEVERHDRRDFLKKAGTVAWVVPTLSAVNMTAAMAGGDGGTTGSVVVTTVPPSTTQGPPCSCMLSVEDVGFEEDTVVFYIHLALGNGCGTAAYTLFTLADDSVVTEPIANRDFRYAVPDDILPTTLLARVVDADMNELSRCSLDLDAPQVRRGAAANGAGGGRLSFRAR